MILDELQRTLESELEQDGSCQGGGSGKKEPLPVLDGSTSGGRLLKKDDYLVWMDADAVFVNHEQKLEDIVIKAQFRDLIIGEDMHVGNLVNCGVILVKMSRWSLGLWSEVFRCRKYDTVTYFEQSALHKVLKTNREFSAFFDTNQITGGLGKKEKDEAGKVIVKESEKTLSSWHSFCVQPETDLAGLDIDITRLQFSQESDPRDSVKVFEHAAVFPMHLLNSNICDEDLATMEDPDRSSIRQLRKVRHRKWTHQKTRFVFHAAGFSRKEGKICAMLRARLPQLDITQFGEGK